MRKSNLLQIAALVLFLPFAKAQSFEVALQNGIVKITDNTPSAMTIAPDLQKVEYIMHGDCDSYRTGKMTPQQNVSFPCPPEFLDGFLLQRVAWYGFIQPNGATKWQSQSSTCYRMAGFQQATTVTDTVFLQPITFNVPPSTNSPDWFTVTAQGGNVQLIATPHNPGNVTQSQVIITSAAGYVVGQTNLPSGMYFATLVLEWQGMNFVETDSFFVN